MCCQKITIDPVTAFMQVWGHWLAVDRAIVVQTATAIGLGSGKSIVSITISTNCTGLII
ncbi:hypothetical protein [Microcoleus sp.]|uniref:hypothetical protein n=1 Tax=Microcoleus sp. TaxID=44472 RepID=UPI003524F0AF